MSLVQRTIKLVLVTLLTFGLAELLGLSYASSAGIIAILSVLETRRSSVKMAIRRFLSALLALGIAWLVFQLLGFHFLSLGLYLVFYVPLAYRWQLEAGVAPVTVLVTHLYLERSVSPAWLVNEMGLFLIGVGFALLINLYMPSRQEEIDHYHQQVEEKLRAILQRFETFLLQGDGTNDAQLIGELNALLDQALRLVYLDRHNQVFHQTNYQVHYFEMRQQQSKILSQMAQNINVCYLESQESLILAKLFAQAAQQLSQENPGQELLAGIAHFRQTFRERSLPQTRQEFETRAILYQLLNDMERFIQLKVDFYQTYQDKETR